MSIPERNSRRRNHAVRTPTVDDGHRGAYLWTSTEDAIAAHKHTPDWLPTLLALLPALPMLIIYGWPKAWPDAAEFQRRNWGNLISSWGLGVSLGVLFYAKGARRAAQDAQKEIRRRSLAEELHDAHSRALEVGTSMRDGKWDIVFLRAQEISAACGIILSRRLWLTASSKENIGVAREQANSIERFAISAKLTRPSAQQILTASASQRRLRDLLSDEFGGALANAEGSETKDVQRS